MKKKLCVSAVLTILTTVCFLMGRFTSFTAIGGVEMLYIFGAMMLLMTCFVGGWHFYYKTERKFADWRRVGMVMAVFSLCMMVVFHFCDITQMKRWMCLGYDTGAIMVFVFCCYDLFKQKADETKVRRRVRCVKDGLLGMGAGFSAFALSKWLFNLPVSDDIWMITVSLTVASLVNWFFILCVAEEYIGNREKLALKRSSDVSPADNDKLYEKDIERIFLIALFVALFLIVTGGCMYVGQGYGLSYGKLGDIFSANLPIGFIVLIVAFFIIP